LFQVPQTKAPPFASVLLYKLYKKENEEEEEEKQFYVVVEYNGVKIDMTKFCGQSDCDAQEMITALRSDILPDIVEYCKEIIVPVETYS